MCAKFPEKAREIRTGALNSVQAGQVVFIESTADGHEGHFFDLCEAAQTRQRIEAPLTPLDFKFNFFPWHKAPEYELDPRGVTIDDNFRRYFETLHEAHGITLSDAQRAWYVKKSDTQLEDMKREYPSTPDEAFAASVEGAYYAQQMAKAELEHRIGSFPAEPGYPVHTAWDIGHYDDNAFFCFQLFPGAVRLVGYYSNSGEALPHYLDWLELAGRERSWTYGTHYLPHDISIHEWTNGKTRIEQMLKQVRMRRLGKTVIKVPLHAVDDGINSVRMLIPICQFDAGPCSEDVKALKNYRKDWDGERGVWKDRPRHDASSHGADAFRCLAMSYKDIPIEAKAPEVELDPLSRVIPSAPRTWLYLSEMTYADFHRETGTELGKQRRKSVRV